MHSGLPKLLHPMLGLPLLDHLLRALGSADCSDIVVVTGHKGKQIEEAFSGRGLRFARQSPPRGTGDAVAEAFRQQPPLCSRTLIVNGDLPLITAATIAEMVGSEEALNSALTVLSLVVTDPAGFGRLIFGEEGSLQGVIEDKDATTAQKSICQVNGGVYLADSEILATVVQEWCEQELARIDVGGAGPGEVYFPPVIGEMKKRGHAVRCWSLPAGREDELQQVNDRVQLSQATRFACDREIRRHQIAGVTVVDPSNTWIEVDVKIGPDSLVHPFTVLRRGVVAGSSCELGPFAHLREGTHLGNDVKIGNFTEVKNSTIGDGSRAKHLSYIGDGDIGKKVNIGAGTVLANYDGKRKSKTSIGDGAFIGSGTILVAPVEVGPGAITGAGAVVLKNQVIAEGQTVVGVPARPLDEPVITDNQQETSPVLPEPQG